MPERRPEWLATFVTTSAADVGCEETWRLIHVYADALVAGEDPEMRFPGIAAHLASCPPCADDLAGLLSALDTAHRVAHERGTEQKDPPRG